MSSLTGQGGHSRVSDQAFSGQVTSLEAMLSAWRPRSKVITGLALLFGAAAILTPVALLKVTFLLVAGVMLLVSLAAHLGPPMLNRLRDYHLSRHLTALRVDPCPVIVSDCEDRVIFANTVSARDLGAAKGMGLSEVMQGLVADPHHAIEDLRRDLTRSRSLRRQLARVAGALDVDVMALPGGMTAWRFNLQENEAQTENDTLAVLTLNDEDVVLHANAAARALLGPHADMVPLFCPNPPLRLDHINDIRAAKGLLRCFVHEMPTAGPKPGSTGGSSRGAVRQVAIIPAAEDQPPEADTWSIIEDLPVPLLRLSADGVIELSNRPARVVLGVESGAGRRLSDLMEGPGRPISDWLHDTVEGHGTVRPEILQMRRKDKDVFVQVTLNPVRDGGKTVIIAVLQDATKLKTLELQFVQSQKMQAIGQLAGGVAHDFNNLLTAISGHCDLLLMKYGVDDPTYPDLMQISQNTNRAAALVGQLLAYSRKQMLRLEIMSLRDMLSDVTHLLNRLVGEKVQLVLDHDPDLWSVRADKRQLEQVLMNLVVNARDAMPSGGQVVIRTENCLLKAPLKRDRAEVAPGRYVVVSVKDEGKGIPEDFIERVFEPFYTSKKQGEGTGLGLSTAYGIVKQTGGFIFVDSAPGQGATFQIYLPAHHAETVKDSPVVPVRTALDKAQGVVMLVEDEAPVRAFASRALKMKGFSVIEAASGEDALSLLEDDALHIDVIVTDVVMPGLDGPTWVSQAMHTRPDTKVVFVSGYAADSVDGGVMPGMPSVFLPKPFSLTELVDTVQSQLATAAAAHIPVEEAQTV
ncbi:MAG: ATP-binding protein [Pseudomonadota bacterium]